MNIYQFIMRILEKFRTSDYQSDVSGASHSDPSQEVNSTINFIINHNGEGIINNLENLYGLEISMFWITYRVAHKFRTVL